MVQYTVCFVLCFYLLCNTALHDLVTFLSVQIKTNKDVVPSFH